MAATLRQAVQFCTTRDNVRIAYATMGRGAPLVRTAHFLTHVELDVASPVWVPWLAELSRNRRLVRYDGRNCGLSDRTPAPLGLDAWLADLEAVIDAAKLERFSLFGCSQGGAIAIAYAARNPDRVSSLVLLGAYGRGLMKRDPTPAQVTEARALLELVEVGWGRDNPAFRNLFTSLFIPGGTAEQTAWFSELERLTIAPSDAARVMAAFGQIDVTAEAAAVGCPTLVLHAVGDARVPYEEGRRLAATIPGARFVSLDSRNHVLLDHEPAFRHCFDEINAFLDEHSSGEETHAFSNLTKGERDLVELLAHGLDNLQIAARLGLSEKTVRNKVSSVFAKLGAETRAQAIVRARQAGFATKPLDR